MQAVGNHVEVLGPYVNIAHRLLENSPSRHVGSAAYALFTETAIDALDLPLTDALDVAAITRASPISYGGLREAHLPECEFRGRDNRKIQYAILTSVAVKGGLEPDLLEEMVRWRTDDYWRYALYAAVALIRAAAERRGDPVARLAEQLAERHGVAWT